MDLQISYEQLNENKNKGIFNQSDIRKLVQQSVQKAEKRLKDQFIQQSGDYQDNKDNKHLTRVYSSKYTFDNVSKTIYFLDHQLLSIDQNTVEKILLQLSNFFQFLFENPSHKIKNGEIINIEATENQIHRKISIQSLNPLIARMLDMFLNSKIFVFKNYIADILIRYAFVIKQIIIKEELLQILNKGIKGFDEYTRIISVKIVPSFIQMFEKDLVGFQYIVHKIQSFNQTTFINVSSFVQKLSFVDCLEKMLQKSEILSSFFIKNIKEQTDIINFHPLSKCMEINQMSILRFCQFCLHLKINTSSSLELFKNILKIYKNRQKSIQTLDIEVLNKLKELISKILQKLFDQNFKVLEVIYVQNLEKQIEVDIKVINRKLKSFDLHQQKYILKDCPSKLRQILTSHEEKCYQKSQSLQQKMFMKFYKKLNDFDTENMPSQVNQRKSLIVKQRRLEQFLELSEYQKHKKISSLIKFWLHINSLMLDVLNKSRKQVILIRLETSKSLIQKLASQHQDLQEQLLISAEVFLLLQKCYMSQNVQYLFKHSFWTNSQKLPAQNKHFLKWTVIGLKTLQKLIF